MRVFEHIFEFLLMLIFVLFLIFLVAKPQKVYARRLTGTTSLEAEFFNDLKDQKLQSFSLADAFFIASGIRDQQQLSFARTKFQELVETAKKDLLPYQDEEMRGDYLLQWLHQKVFTHYQSNATDAYSLLKHGTYNCLSSCLIYGLIAQELGYKVSGVAVDKHAFCRFYGKKGKGKDVETTNRFGFNPGRELLLDKMVVSVPRNQYRNRMEISLLEMIGLIYTNHLGMNQAYPGPKEQLLALQKARLFLSKSPKNYFNQIITHNMKVCYQEIISTAGQGKNLEEINAYIEMWQEDLPGSDWEESFLFAMQTIAQKYDRARDYVLGVDKIRSIRALYPNLAQSLFHLEGYLLFLASQSAFKKQADNQAEKYFQEALGTQKITQKYTSQLTAVIQSNYFASLKNVLIILINQKQIEEAKKLIKIALTQYPKDPDLQRFNKGF